MKKARRMARLFHWIRALTLPHLRRIITMSAASFRHAGAASRQSGKVALGMRARIHALLAANISGAIRSLGADHRRGYADADNKAGQNGSMHFILPFMSVDHARFDATGFAAVGGAGRDQGPT
jgi:hypothetical protein